MLSTQVIALSLALAPSLALAGMFPADSVVKMLDPTSFRKVMKVNQTSIIAFVAPWCGHCQRMSPEFSKAALGLYPLIPAYAVDCDQEMNKRLCYDQGVKGFPTVKVFPRGKSLPPMTYESGERTASALFYFASRRIPQQNNKKFFKVDDITSWIAERAEKSKQPRTLLLTKDKKVPLLWQTLANKYDGQVEFASHRDRKGKTSVTMGYEAGGPKQPKVIVYPIGSKDGVLYEGINKLESLSKFFDSVIDGTADLKVANKAAAAEEVVLSKEEEEIAQKQEAQRIALAHGGFSNLVDFEAAVKRGDAANYHDTYGFGMMGDIPAGKVKMGDGESDSVKKEEPVKSEGQGASETVKSSKSEVNADSATTSSTPVVQETHTAQAVFNAPEPVTQEAESVVSTAKATANAHPTDEL